VDHYIEALSATSLGTSNQLSISLWFNCTSFSNLPTIISKWTHQSQGEWSVGFFTSGLLGFFPARTLNDNGAAYSISNTLSVNTLYHAVITYDGSQPVATNRIKFHINNINLTQTVSAQTPSSLIDSDSHINIGKWGGSLDRFFSGIIDDIRIYNRVLTPTEITALYEEGGYTP
jgi:hypothetical protein